MGRVKWAGTKPATVGPARARPGTHCSWAVPARHEAPGRAWAATSARWAGPARHEQCRAVPGTARHGHGTAARHTEPAASGARHEAEAEPAAHGAARLRRREGSEGGGGVACCVVAEGRREEEVLRCCPSRREEEPRRPGGP